MEIPESEDHDCMVFTVSPSTSSSDVSDSASEPFTINCVDSAIAHEMIDVGIGANEPYAVNHVYTETMENTTAVSGVEGSLVSQTDQACRRSAAFCQRPLPEHGFDKHFHEKDNKRNLEGLQQTDRSFVYPVSRNTPLHKRSNKDEDDIKEQVQKLQDSLQDIRHSNLIKRKQLFWHALKDYQLAKMNWEGQDSILANCISLVGGKTEKSSPILDLAKHFILLNIKTKTIQLLHKVQKNAAKYKRIDNEMVQHFKRCCSGEVCRRLVELWRDETYAEERISWLTWNFKKASYINNGDKFAHFLYGIKEQTKYSRNSKQESSFREKTYGARGVTLRCHSTDNHLSISSESIENGSDRPVMNYGRGDYNDFPLPR